MVVHTFNSTAQEAEPGVLPQVQSQPSLQTKTLPKKKTTEKKKKEARPTPPTHFRLDRTVESVVFV